MSDKHVSGQFREAFKGYHKDDVNAYIQQMFHQFEERERMLLRQRKEGAPQPPMPAASNEQLEELKNQIAAREGEIELLRQRLSTMEENAARYEKMSAQVGDIMLRARSDADRITEAASESAKRREQEAEARVKASVAEAEGAARAVREEAEAYAAAIRAEALKQADTIISYAADRMKHLYNEETEGYAKVLDTLKHQTVHFAEKLSEYRESFPHEVQDAQDIAKEAVRQIASELTKDN